MEADSSKRQGTEMPEEVAAYLSDMSLDEHMQKRVSGVTGNIAGSTTSEIFFNSVRAPAQDAVLTK